MKILITRAGEITVLHESKRYDVAGLHPHQLPPELNATVGTGQLSAALLSWVNLYLDHLTKWRPKDIEICVVGVQLQRQNMLYWDAAANITSALQEKEADPGAPRYDIPEAHGIVDHWLRKVERAQAGDENHVEMSEFDP